MMFSAWIGVAFARGLLMVPLIPDELNQSKKICEIL